jgi:hypothetical protein
VTHLEVAVRGRHVKVKAARAMLLPVRRQWRGGGSADGRRDDRRCANVDCRDRKGQCVAVCGDDGRCVRVRVCACVCEGWGGVEGKGNGGGGRGGWGGGA